MVERSRPRRRRAAARGFAIERTCLEQTCLGSDPGRGWSGRRPVGQRSVSRARGTAASRSDRPSRAAAADRAGRSGCRGSGSRAGAPRRRTPHARSWATRARRTDGSGLRERERAERGRLPERRHLHAVDPHRLARGEARAAGPGATPETAIPLRRLPSHGTALAARTGRASIAAYVSNHSWSVAALGAGTRRVDSIARRRSSSARIRRASAGVAFARRERRQIRGRGCRRSGRGSCRSPPARRACVVDRRGLREHGVLELGREGEVAVARQPVQRGDVAREQPGRPEHAERPGRQRRRRRRATGRDPSRRARAHRRASGRASTATRRPPWACRGRCPPD